MSKYSLDNMTTCGAGMSRDSYERHINSNADYYERENSRRFYEHENEYWHSEAGQYHIRYNDARASEIQKRNKEILDNLTHFFFSKKVIVILILSVILCVIASTLSVMGFIIWTILLVAGVWLDFHLTAKTIVLPEIDRHIAIKQSARDKAYR